MVKSRYEKYVVREPMHPDPGLYQGGMVPTRFLEATLGTMKESDTMLEFAWIDKDWFAGMSTERGPHEHNFDEIFLFLGTNREDSNDLGAEVEFWMGGGEETEIIKINTSSLIFVPGGVIHLPMFFKNVKKPMLVVVIGLNVGEMKVIRYPVRG